MHPTHTEQMSAYRSWPTQKTEFKRFADYIEHFDATSQEDLREYAATGRHRGFNSAEAVPAWRYPSLAAVLMMRAMVLNQRGQIHTIGAEAQTVELGGALAYARLAQLINFYNHELFPGRTLQTLSLQHTACWVAAGFAAGCQGAERLGLLALEAGRRGYYFDVKFYPIFHFILLLFSATQGLEIEPWSSAATREPALTSLLEKWQTRDVSNLTPLVIAVCDFHTHRCKPRTKDWNEFSSGVGSNFTRMPIEILMLYRLRERRGLANPDVDHPLMNSPLGKLCEPMSCKPDDLLLQVLDRASSQGFDEDAIVESILSDSV